MTAENPRVGETTVGVRGAPDTPGSAPDVPAPTPPPAQAAEVKSGSVTVSRVSRARARPRGSRKELMVWYLMRVTAVALFVLALAHFSILHFIWDPSEQNADFIANQRWNQLFWRGFDWLLLMTVLFHGFLGVRTVILDYVHRPGLRTGSLWLLYVIGLTLFIMGSQVILTLPTPADAAATVGSMALR
jgi:succinate dehydrogenase / fumarate reductase, membrane anchor subunit